MKTRVLVVDDSALMRGLLTQMIQLSPDMEVVGTAQDALTARELTESLNPDVLTLDVNMPGMDGLQVLEVLSRRNGKSGIILMSDTNEELAGAVAMSKERGLKLIGALIKPFDLKQVKEVLQFA